MSYAVLGILVALVAILGVRAPWPMIGIGVLLLLLFGAFLMFGRKHTRWPRLALALSGASALVGIWDISLAIVSIAHAAV